MGDGDNNTQVESEDESERKKPSRKRILWTDSEDEHIITASLSSEHENKQFETAKQLLATMPHSVRSDNAIRNRLKLMHNNHSTNSESIDCVDTVLQSDKSSHTIKRRTRQHTASNSSTSTAKPRVKTSKNTTHHSTIVNSINTTTQQLTTSDDFINQLKAANVTINAINYHYDDAIKKKQAADIAASAASNAMQKLLNLTGSCKPTESSHRADPIDVLLVYDRGFFERFAVERNLVTTPSEQNYGGRGDPYHRVELAIIHWARELIDKPDQIHWQQLVVRQLSVFKFVRTETAVYTAYKRHSNNNKKNTMN